LAELVGTQLLELWLEELQNANLSWSQKKKLACDDSARTTDWMVWYRKICLLAKRTAPREQGFEFKVS
jgi:hypothetical protein